MSHSPTASRAAVAALSLSALLLAPSAAGGQSAALDSLARTNVHTFALSDGRMSGVGADLLRAAAEGALFVTLGENHNTRAIPELTVALFRMLHEAYGFQYLALEEGPALGELLSRRLRTRSADAAFRVGLEFPNAFHMYTEEELRMIDRVAAIARPPSDPVWGLNQEFGLLHVFERLASLAPNAEARRAVAELQRRSREYEGERFARGVAFISDIIRAEDFQRLRAVFRAPAGSEVDRLITQAALSHDIYAPYRMSPQPHFTAFHHSARLREENMKTLFASQYRLAHQAGVERPKVLVKSGHVHLNRGLGAFNEVFTLGNFLSELASFEGGHTVHLHVLLNWEDLPDSFFAPFVPHIRQGENTLFDLRPMQAWAARHAFRDLDPELRRVLVGSDFLVILSDMTPGSIDRLRTPNFRQYTGS